MSSAFAIIANARFCESQTGQAAFRFAVPVSAYMKFTFSEVSASEALSLIPDSVPTFRTLSRVPILPSRVCPARPCQLVPDPESSIGNLPGAFSDLANSSFQERSLDDPHRATTLLPQSATAHPGSAKYPQRPSATALVYPIFSEHHSRGSVAVPAEFLHCSSCI